MKKDKIEILKLKQLKEQLKAKKQLVKLHIKDVKKIEIDLEKAYNKLYKLRNEVDQLEANIEYF